VEGEYRDSRLTGAARCKVRSAGARVSSVYRKDESDEGRMTVENVHAKAIVNAKEVEAGEA
jgi:hypothetical protein